MRAKRLKFGFLSLVGTLINRYFSSEFHGRFSCLKLFELETGWNILHTFLAVGFSKVSMNVRIDQTTSFYLNSDNLIFLNKIQSNSSSLVKCEKVQLLHNKRFIIK